MIESTLYAILSGAGLPCQPTTPAVDTALPVVVYTVTSATPTYGLDGTIVIVRAMVDIDIFTRTLAECTTLLAVARTALDSSTMVIGSNLLTQQQQDAPGVGGHYGSQQWSVWAAVSSAAYLRAGTGRVGLTGAAAASHA